MARSNKRRSVTLVRRTVTPKPGRRASERHSQRNRLASRSQLLEWRRHERDVELRSAITATNSLQWSHDLVMVLLEELCVDEYLEKHLGPLGQLGVARIPQALAMAVVLRHSWHPDDLDAILAKLGIPKN